MTRIALALAALAPLAAPGRVAAQSPSSCEVPPSIASTRPDPTAPTRVHVGLYLIDLRSIDDSRQAFDADIAVNLSWQDMRLVADSDRSLAGCTVPLGSLWNPGTQVLNERALSKRFPEEASVLADGTVRHQQRFMGELTFPFALQDFPFDSHDLEVEIVCPSYGPEEVSLLVDRERSGRSAELSIADWSVGAGSVASEPLFVEAMKRSLSRIVFRTNVSRLRGFYLWKVLLPLSLIVLMSWAAFWINPRHLPAQIAVSTSAVLTLIAFQFSLGYLLPRLSYLTRADRFTMGSTALVFLAFGEALVTGFLADRERVDLALRIDRHSRWLFPLGFVLVHLLSFRL